MKSNSNELVVVKCPHCNRSNANWSDIMPFNFYISSSTWTCVKWCLASIRKLELYTMQVGLFVDALSDSKNNLSDMSVFCEV